MEKKDSKDEGIMKEVRKLANLLGKTEDEILSLIEQKKEEMAGLLTDYGALSGVASDFGIRISELIEEEISFSKIKDILLKKEVCVNVIGRVKRILPIKEFQRKDGTIGKVARIIISDETGEIPVVLWDAHSEISNKVKFNDIIRIIKGTTKVSTFNEIEKVEINLTSFSIIDINPEFHKAITIPEIPEYIQTIKEVKEKGKDERISVCVIGRIISDIESGEFERIDGSKGVRSSFFIEDETGTIRVVVWDNINEEKGISLGSVVKVRGIAKKGMFDNVEIITNLARDIEKSDVKLNLSELKKIHELPLKIGEIPTQYETLDEYGKRVFTLTTKGVITRNFGIIEFEDIQGNVGKRWAFILNDGTGSIRVVAWNDAADFAENTNEGDAIEIKRGNIRKNMENYEIHIRRKSDINLISKEEFAGITFSKPETIERKIESLKIEEIPTRYEALSEDEKRIFALTTKGIITRNFGVKEFEDIQGNIGKRCAFMLNDGTGSIIVVTWDEAANFAENVNEGDAVEIKNGIIRKYKENYEIHIRKKDDINLIDKEEFANIIFSKPVVEKKISELSDGDKNVRLVIKIIDVDSNQQLTYPACSICNKKVINIGNNEWYCEKCGKTVEQVPRLILRVIGADIHGNDQIKMVFFGDNVEKIMGMNMAKILNLVGESGEQAVIEKVKTELQNSVKIITGYVKFDKNFEEKVFYVDKIEN